mgnify:CR=1 FL=1
MKYLFVNQKPCCIQRNEDCRDTLAEQQQEPVTMDDVTAVIAGQIGQLLPAEQGKVDGTAEVCPSAKGGQSQNKQQPTGLQLVTGHGIFELDDLLHNFTGSLFGYFVIMFFLSCFREKKWKWKPFMKKGFLFLCPCSVRPFAAVCKNCQLRIR